MAEKGLQTREFIRQKAYFLFANLGFQAVTMKNICDECELSRGGLYRHYGSTRQIFEEILADLSEHDDDLLSGGMANHQSALEILEEELKKMQMEMQSPDTSLSYAIYEYSLLCDNRFILELNQRATTRWRNFLAYGIQRGEFCPVDIGQMTDLILYVYQGVRMWSRVIPIKHEVAKNIITKIRMDLIGGESL